jgi:phytoene dehydrogenase-like protein
MESTMHETGPEQDATTDQRTDVVVVGGGLAGLTTAVLAARSGVSVTLIDSGGLGGRARTTVKDGYRLNQGPRAVYLSGPAVTLLRTMGITLTGGSPPATSAHVVYRGEMHRMPANPALMLRSRLLSAREKARLGLLLARLGRIDTASLSDRSAAEWLAGLELGDAASALIATLQRISSYVGEPDQLSADISVAQLRDAVTGPGVSYLDGGWQSLVDQLAARAGQADVRVRTSSAVRSIEAGPTGYRVVTDAGAVVGRALVMAVGSPASTGRLLPAAATWSDLGPDVTAACLDLGLATVASPPAVFSMDEPLYLSTHCPPADLAPPGGSVVHVMRNGARDAALDQADLWRHAARAGIHEPDAVVRRFLPTMTVTHAIPVPGSGGLAGRPSVEVPGLPGAFLAGDWVGGDGLLADASLSSAGVAAAGAVAHVEHGPVTLAGAVR